MPWNKKTKAQIIPCLKAFVIEFFHSLIIAIWSQFISTFQNDNNLVLQE